MAHLDTEKIERLNTWIVEITEVLEADAPHKSQPDGSARFGKKGSLLIGPEPGLWYDFEAGKGGRHATSLIQHLGERDPVSWAKAFLQSNTGVGRLADSQAELDEASVTSSRNAARGLLDKSQPIDGTPAADYLISRGIRPSFPDNLHFVRHARPGEHALLVRIEHEGELAAIQLTYLDDEGKKSRVQPQRRFYRCRQDWRSFSCLTFVCPEAAERTVIAEGLEDALSLWQASAGKYIIASLGVSGIGKGPCLHGNEVVVFRDGDPEGSAAVEGLARGVDRMILEGAFVRVTQTPADADANSLLLSEGTEALIQLIDEAPEARLSRDGEIERCASLEPLDYEADRKRLARDLGIRVSALDRAVEARHHEEDGEGNGALDAIGLTEIVPWPEDVDLGSVLDRAADLTSAYVFMPRQSVDAVVLWSAHTHLMSMLGVSPRLAVQSAGPGCGKTVAMEVVSNLVPKPLTVASITPAAVFRVIEAICPTLLIDEADQLMARRSHDLLAVLNSSHRKSSAHVLRNVEQVPGQFEPRLFSTWAPVMFAGIRELPPTLQDRSIVLRLERALPGEVSRHLVDGHCLELQECARKLARWATDLVKLPDVTLPNTLHNRVGDNWRPLFTVAALAGGDWPARCLQAANYVYGHDDRGVIASLLNDISAVFGERDSITSRELIDSLISHEEGPYSECNRGGPITPYWLSRQLRGVINGGSITIRRRKQTAKGYKREQFKMAWQRYCVPGAEHLSPLASDVGAETAVTNVTRSQRTGDAFIKPVQDATTAEETEVGVGDMKRRDDVTDVPDELPSSGHDTEAW